jgi:hypothetical protein
MKLDIREELKFQLGLKKLRLVNFSTLQEDYRQQLISVRDFINSGFQSYQRDTKVCLLFDFIDSNQLNGLAFSSNSTEQNFRFATVHAGAILYFHIFFPYLMSRMDILPSVGSPALEKNLPITFRPGRSHPAMSPLEGYEIASIVPTCPERLEFANQMARAATLFLAFHEVGHCVNGHVMCSNFQLDEIDEISTQSSEETLRRHTLEMDADAYAVNHLLKLNLHNMGLGTKNDGLSEEQELHLAGLLHPVFIGINLLFRLFTRIEKIPIDQADFLKGTHPNAAVRSHLSRVTVSSIAFAWGLQNKDRPWLTNLATRSAIDALRIWEAITGTQEPARLLLTFMQDGKTERTGLNMVWEYTNSLLECWRTIRPELLPFALNDLVKPTDD